MPELPEVETIRRQLAERLPGRAFSVAEIRDPLLVAPSSPAALAEEVVGRLVLGVGRRAKYLQVQLDSGDLLVMHLRMTGQLYWAPGPPDPDLPYLRASFGFDDGSSLAFCDLRRFGRIWVVPADLPDADAYWAARAGVEPLERDFTARRLAELLARRRAPVKAVLLDQAAVAGIGNIYADEALFGARIHPLRPADSLDAAEVRRLHRAIRDRLAAAVAAGGASIDRYRDTVGQRGSMQDLLRVHLRRGEPCVRCRTEVRKTRVAGRGTYWCPRCQPEPARW
jgi:formamidopyrimidine-DNA glycosylase